MSELSHNPSEMGIQYQREGRIAVITAPHGGDAEFIAEKPIWPPDVNDKLFNLIPRPMILAIDGLKTILENSGIQTPNFFKSLISVNNLANYQQNSGVPLEILGADILSLDFKGRSTNLKPDSLRAYNSVVEAIMKLDPNLYYSKEFNANILRAIALSYILEGTVSTGVTYRILKRMNDQKKPKELTRRDFLKISTVALGGIGFALGRPAAFGISMSQTDISQGPTTILEMIAKLSAPILDLTYFPNMALRQIKLGLATMDKLTSKTQEATAAIIFGSFHRRGAQKSDIYPGQHEDETLPQAKARLTAALRPILTKIVDSIRQKGYIFEPIVLEAALIEIYGTYDTYRGTSNLNAPDSWNLVQTKDIPEIVTLIQEIVSGRSPK